MSASAQVPVARHTTPVCTLAPEGAWALGAMRWPGMTVAEISRRIPKAQQTISSVVARLEKLGLIERRLGSGRGVGLHVTDAGREMAQVAVTHEQELNARLRELLGEERSTALTELLRESRAILREAR